MDMVIVFSYLCRMKTLELYKAIDQNKFYFINPKEILDTIGGKATIKILDADSFTVLASDAYFIFEVL